MQADIEGAVRIARIARDFEWTWGQDDIERFRLAAGWTLLRRGDYGNTSLSTDLRVNLNQANAYSNRRYIRGSTGRNESLERLSINITDVARDADDALTAALSKSFDQLAEKLTREFGLPSHTESKPGAEIGWVEYDHVVNVMTGSTYLLLEVVNPRRWRERQEFDDED
ncbi:DUF6301 family protein [Nocardia tengchongensis]|uniref:DUF6301 family protein n=1 Tax=Nocardia tengchongensis TaxID=2055889 RepID=UPI0036BCE79F